LNDCSLRKRVARETASLLYSGDEKEYKQAKLKAAKMLQSKFLPTNLEVAMELDEIAEENEGSARRERLIQMRKDALSLMRILRAFNPLLIGSVWRGTIHHNSDIDIIAHHDTPADVVDLLKRNNIKIIQQEKVNVTKKGEKKASFHIYVELPTKEEAEIKVIQNFEVNREDKCEIYGDTIAGLLMVELEKLMRENPAQRFLPF